MKYQRFPSTTSLSGDEDENILGKPSFDEAADIQSNITVTPAQWTRPNPPNTKRNIRVSPISRLPPELLIHILKHIHSSRDLSNSIQVCRTWCECSVELLWHKPNLNKYAIVEKMARLLATPDQTFTYASFIRRLNFLAVSRELRDDIFCNFAKCDRLERLTLVNCKELSEEAITATLPSFPSLVAVDLTGVLNTSDEAIIGLASAAKRLQGINLTGCKHVSDGGLSGLEDLTDEPLRILAKSCPLLLEIELTNCRLVTDAAIRDVWTYSTHMREMRLSQCSELTDTAFPAPIRRDMKNVSEASVNPFANSAANSTDLPPLIINRTFEHLRMLDLTACSKVTDDAIEGIVSHAPKIRNLVLSKCGLLTDRSVESVCKLGRHLHYLHLGHTSKITDASVRTLARSCTRLRYVDFANCQLLTDLAVFELAGLPKLRRIGLVRVHNLTDEAVFALAERHATLERIHLSYCDQISVMAIHFLLQKLHKLTHLSLTGVTAFRQPELQRFCRAAPADFNSAQQNAFCVFSGGGVVQLRAYLTEVFDRITEQNGTDDTEYEDDDDIEEEDTPEPEADVEGEEEYISRSIFTNNPHVTVQRSHRPNGYGAIWPRDPGLEEQLLPTIPTDRPIPNSLLARLNAVMAAEPSASRSSSSRSPPSSGATSRNIAETLPIIENSQSPPLSDVASNASGASNGAGFFRSYQDGVVFSRANEVRTPDLNFAEIGHGRGAVEGGGFSTLSSHAPLSMRRAQLDHSNPSSSSQGQSFRNTNSTPSSGGVAWPYREPVSPPPTGYDAEPELNDVQKRDSSRELHESVRAALIGASSSGGRGVRKSLRNTFSAAEHNISSFLFGRSPPRSEDGHASGSHSRNARGH
ncbi:RNI-like protein [Gymnopus androsaceus JB14]|uniref:RNI-like protein n=1 Tax=Gymnopus androsaceus JB14 TaxID=1447944 RepID=A0A6A4ID88_9AGAR|nr:RNI-like protein [Gymnopus androsaceus JB14]